MCRLGQGPRGRTQPLALPALQSRRIREGRSVHRFRRSLAHFSVTSLINSSGRTHEVKGGVFFLPFSYIFILFLPFELPTPELGLAYMPPPAAASTVDTKPDALLCWISHVAQRRSYFLLRSHPRPPRSGPVPMPEKTKPSRGARGRGEPGRSQAGGRNPPSLPGTAGDAAGHGATRRLGATGRTAP